jgi:hypothetical protein
VTRIRKGDAIRVFANLAFLSLGVFVFAIAVHGFTNGVDFNVYFAGGYLERIGKHFDQTALIQDYLRNNHLVHSLAKAPFPFGSVVLISLVFVPLSHLSPSQAGVLLELAVAVVTVSALMRFDQRWQGLIVGLFLLNRFVIEASTIGNWSAITIPLMFHAGFDIKNGSSKRAAIIIGMISAFKIYPAFLLIYFVAKQKYRELCISMLTVVAMSIVSILIIGPQHFFHGAVVSISSKVPEASKPFNHSLPGVFAAFNDSRLLLLVVSVVCVLIGCWIVFKFRSVGDYELFLLTLSLCYLVSPLSWNFYAISLLPVFVYLFSNSRSLTLKIALSALVIWGVHWVLISRFVYDHLIVALAPTKPNWLMPFWLLPTYAAILCTYGLMRELRDRGGKLVELESRQAA